MHVAQKIGDSFSEPLELYDEACAPPLHAFFLESSARLCLAIFFRFCIFHVLFPSFDRSIFHISFHPTNGHLRSRVNVLQIVCHLNMHQSRFSNVSYRLIGTNFWMHCIPHLFTRKSRRVHNLFKDFFRRRNHKKGCIQRPIASFKMLSEKHTKNVTLKIDQLILDGNE